MIRATCQGLFLAEEGKGLLARERQERELPCCLGQLELEGESLSPRLEMELESSQQAQHPLPALQEPAPAP